MFFSLSKPLSKRFARLIAFCWRRGIRVGASETGRWQCSSSAVYAVVEEIENDKDGGLFSFAHELGHICFTGVASINSWFWRLYDVGSLLGLGVVLARELTAWVGGFFILNLLGTQFSLKAYTTQSLRAVGTYLTHWRDPEERMIAVYTSLLGHYLARRHR